MLEDLTVRDVMSREYVGVSESDTVGEVARLMLEENESNVAVVRGAEPIGAVMGPTIIATLLESEYPYDASIDTVMERAPRAVRPELALDQAAAILADAATDHVFVTSGDEILGVLTENDLITAVTSILTTEPDETYDDDYAVAGTASPEAPGAMSAQSVCEVCGTLKTDLENINGQMICDDCRSV